MAPGTSPFGRSLRHWRRLRGVSQLELAGLAATTTRYLSYLETGRARPSQQMVARLADALQVPLRDRIDNWPEITFALLGRLSADLMRFPDDPALLGLHAEVRDALGDTRRLHPPTASRVICPRFRMNGTLVSTITAARFESVTDIALDEIRIELIYPADSPSEQFFRDLATS